MSESLLAETEAAMRRLGEPRVRDPKLEGEMVAEFLKTLVDEGVQADMLKDLVIAYILRL
jgi:hypothetical protein